MPRARRVPAPRRRSPSPTTDADASDDAEAAAATLVTNVSAWVDTQRPKHPDGTCPPFPPPPSAPPALVTTETTLKLANSRIAIRGKTLLLDGAPWIMRGICYSPVPYGADPGYGEPWGDYFVWQYTEIFTRDIDLMARMGANTLRLYTLKTSRRHTPFFDAALAAGLVVVGAFEMGTANETPLDTPANLEAAQRRLRDQLRSTGAHPAVVMWMVGNELNGGWQLHTCDNDFLPDCRTLPREARERRALREAGNLTTAPHRGRRAAAFLEDDACCRFGDDAHLLGLAVDALCAVVEEEGVLCSTPLAGVGLAPKYMGFGMPAALPCWSPPDPLPRRLPRVSVVRCQRRLLPGDVRRPRVVPSVGADHQSHALLERQPLPRQELHVGPRLRGAGRAHDEAVPRHRVWRRRVQLRRAHRRERAAEHDRRR